jgi:sulfate adenylyltransferase (ADP) / ATP adenylyltransferase
VPTLLEYYRYLLESVGIAIDPTGQPTGAYNLLVTRRWMAIVARSQESFQTISVNSLGFAGSLFVKDQAQMERLKQLSPLEVLKQVGFANKN